MSGTQIVASSNGKALVPKSNPPKTFLLPFGKHNYLVPSTAIKSYPKYPNDQIKTGEDLGALLATKAPEKWKPYCKPEFLCRIEGETGNCVYTTFKVPSYPDEVRILRHITATVAAKNFESVQKEALEKAEAEGTPMNERHKIRMDVLNWKQEQHCPNRAQINPEIEKWDLATGADAIKSCAIKPETKKRAKPGATQEEEAEAKRRQYICHEEFVKQPPGTTYKINEVNGLLHVLFYRTAATAVVEDDEDDQ
jgi:hypothetical protein